MPIHRGADIMPADHPPGKFPELAPEALRGRVDPAELPFESTAVLTPLESGVMGQARGIGAIRFGVGLKNDGYHIFVAGPPKAGLTYIAKTLLEDQARREADPPDWCYVHNFEAADKPRSLKLRAGRGKDLKRDMEELIETLHTRIPEVFDSDDYRARENEVSKGFDRQRRKLEEELSRTARAEGFLLQVSQVGMVIIPVDQDGKPLDQKAVNQLGDEEKQRLQEKSEALQAKMKTAFKRMRALEGEYKKEHARLDNEIALFCVEHIMESLLEKYRDEPDVTAYLKAVQKDILDNIDDFKKKPDEKSQPSPFRLPIRESTFRKYEINVLLDNSETQGAPVVIESNPTYPNLFGTIDKQAVLGAFYTDFSMIKPGALHRANGGYLIMKARDLLKWFLSYEALKRALNNHEIKIEDPSELYGLFGTRSLRPEPIPLKVKIILTGDPFIYELLYTLDERFQKFFKVKAHLDDRIDRAADHVRQFAQMIARFCREEGFRHVARGGAARLLEYSMELTQDQDKLSLELGDIRDLIREADYFAGQSKAELIDRQHVETAVRSRIQRANLVEDRVMELVKKDICWVETEGSKVGQINGLSILMTGDHLFGKPNRITATVSVGREGVVAIERESKLSGKLHTKGVMILSNFLKEHFGRNKPISLTASLCFEQSYGPVEGDSASSTELYAILSALAEVPIRQGIAVTGSVSQKGEIQPVGGVTRKIEAFFEICRHKGLTGGQGVIIPQKNVRHLMLRQDVVDAVRDGQFHVWPVSRVEEGIEILTGLPAGRPGTDDTYTEGTVFFKVDQRLRRIAQIVKDFGGSPGEKNDASRT
jgi:lon-related putative ATP-dependent protease